MVSVFNGATQDLAVSNLTLTFPDLQNERTYTQAPKPLLIASAKPYNSWQTIGSLSLELRKSPIDTNMQNFINFQQISFKSFFDSPTKFIIPT